LLFWEAEKDCHRVEGTIGTQTLFLAPAATGRACGAGASVLAQGKAPPGPRKAHG